jgi:hypothetical protein
MVPVGSSGRTVMALAGMGVVYRPTTERANALLPSYDDMAWRRDVDAFPYGDDDV